MSIQEHLNKIRNAKKGSEIRESIAKGIETAYDDASENGNANMEVKMARGTHPTLRDRLNEVDDIQQRNTAQLAQKATKGDIGLSDLNKNKLKLDGTWFEDSFLEDLSNGAINTTYLEDKSVTTPKLVDRAVTPRKMIDSYTIEPYDIEKANAKMSEDRLWSKREPISKSGLLSIEFKSWESKDGKIVIFEKQTGTTMKITYVQNFTSKVGLNYIYINYEPKGDGTEFVGIYRGGALFLNRPTEVGHLSATISSDNIAVGDTVTYSDTPTGQIELGFNVVITYNHMTQQISNIKDKLSDTSVHKSPKEIFSDYLLKGGNGVLIGDSNTAGQGTSGYDTSGEKVGNSETGASVNSHSWSNRLISTVKTINPNTNLRNWGLSGWHTTAFIGRGLVNFIQPTDNIAIVMLGTNDRVGQTPTQFENKLQTIVSHCKAMNVPVILMSCIPAKINNDNNSSTYNFDTFTVNNVVKKVANLNGMDHIDNYDWFMRYNEEVGNVDALYSDSLHMTDFGSYEYLFRNVIRSLGISYRRDEIDR